MQAQSVALVALLLWLTGCCFGGAADPVAPIAPAASTAPVAAPEPAAEEVGLRAWAVQMRDLGVAGANSGAVYVSMDTQEASARQAGHPILGYYVSTVYSREGASGNTTVDAWFTPDRDVVRYAALHERFYDAVSAPHPAVDHDPVLARWDEIVRRRAQDCSFARLDPADLPERLRDDRQRELESMTAGCAELTGALAAGASRADHYSVGWYTDTGGGAVNFRVGADGAPVFDGNAGVVFY